jgi:hypothetical protein
MYWITSSELEPVCVVAAVIVVLLRSEFKTG